MDVYRLDSTFSFSSEGCCWSRWRGARELRCHIRVSTCDVGLVCIFMGCTCTYFVSHSRSPFVNNLNNTYSIIFSFWILIMMLYDFSSCKILYDCLPKISRVLELGTSTIIWYCRLGHKLSCFAFGFLKMEMYSINL